MSSLTFTEIFTILHNAPEAPKDHCERGCIRSRYLSGLSPSLLQYQCATTSLISHIIHKMWPANRRQPASDCPSPICLSLQSADCDVMMCSATGWCWAWAAAWCGRRACSCWASTSSGRGSRWRWPPLWGAASGSSFSPRPPATSLCKFLFVIITI